MTYLDQTETGLQHLEVEGLQVVPEAAPPVHSAQQIIVINPVKAQEKVRLGSRS